LQAFISEKLGGSEKKPVFFVFHGGSGSEKDQIHTAIK
jgi:fructose-bisphosphate aldolase class II